MEGAISIGEGGTREVIDALAKSVRGDCLQPVERDTGSKTNQKVVRMLVE